VREIIRAVEIVPVPFAPPGVLGIAEIHGGIATILDLAPMLGAEDRRREDGPAICIFIDGDGDPIGIRADAACEIASIPVAAIEPPPAHLAAEAKRHLRGIVRQGRAPFLVIDSGALL